MSNPIKKLLQLPWKPFKKRFDRIDRNLAAGRFQAILMQAENNGLLLGSMRRENRDAHTKFEAIVERLSQNAADTNQVIADLNQVIQDMSGRVADLAAKFETLNALDRVLAANDARTEELENKVDELLERLDALEAAVERSNAGTKPSKD